MTAGFQKRVSTPGAKTTNLARISRDGIYALCSCGWAFGHARDKVREDAVDRHLDKRHDGRGIRL